jgi:serine phosphatase RsbU (regulator of sigma subunit)
MNSRGADRRRAFPRIPATHSGLAFERRKSDDRRRNGFISRLQLFATLPYDAVETVLAQCVARDVPAGTVLLEPGQCNDAIHLLVAGRLRIHLDRPDSADFIAIEEGGCFGELSIIDGRPVSAYVVAEVASRVMMIDEHVFWQRLIPHPGVARNLLTVLSERMRQNRDIILNQMKDKLALEHLQKELSLAHNLQVSMLPAGDALFRNRTEVAAYATMEPAKNIGGDFYDAFFAAPDRLFVAVGDVSGKGIPAALFMVRTITQLRMEAVLRRSPSSVLEAVNRALCEANDAGMFVTLFCGVLETDTGKFSFANAGHNPPLFLGAGGTQDFLPTRKGLVAGIIDGTRYPLVTRQMKPGDTLLLYTDGVTEAMNTAGEFYTEARLLASVRTGSWHDPRSLIEGTRASLAQFAENAEPADDITMLAMRFCGNAVDAAHARDVRFAKT